MSDIPQAGLQNQICLMTGATAGIGAVTAQELARQGAIVVLVGRNPEKSAATVAAIRQATGSDRVDYMLADLSVQKDVYALADQFMARYPRLDRLVNNAGAIFARRRETADGLEMTLALNHLAPFLLTNLLLDRLKASPAARVVNVSAVAHVVAAQIDFDELQKRKSYRWWGWAAYSQAKLANIMFTYELARRLHGTNITVNALHPGIILPNLEPATSVIFKIWPGPSSNASC